MNKNSHRLVYNSINFIYQSTDIGNMAHIGYIGYDMAHISYDI